MVSPSCDGRRRSPSPSTLSHQTSYTPDEEIAFRHVRHYLGRYDTYVVIPESHQAIYPGMMPKRFPDRFFGSPRAHSLAAAVGGLLPVVPASTSSSSSTTSTRSSSPTSSRDWCARWLRLHRRAVADLARHAAHHRAEGRQRRLLAAARVAASCRVLESRRRTSSIPDEYWRTLRGAHADALTRRSTRRAST